VITGSPTSGRSRRFGADASHELRTPLAGLRSIFEVARSRERPAADYRRAIDEALDVCRQLGALVESLLALARLDAGQELQAREPIDLAELVRECEGFCADVARRRGLRFDNRVAEHASVTSDRERLRVRLDFVLQTKPAPPPELQRWVGI